MTEPDPQPDAQPSFGTTESPGIGPSYPAYPAYGQPPSYGQPQTPGYGTGFPQYPPQYASHPGQPPKKNRTGLIIGIIVGTVVLIGAVAVAVPLIFLGKVTSDLDEIGGYNVNTDKILADELDVTLGTFTVTPDDYHDKTKLPVTLKNKSDERRSFIVQIEAVDSSGARIAEDTVSAENLAPGQSTSDDAFAYIDQNKISDLQDATFNVFKVTRH